MPEEGITEEIQEEEITEDVQSDTEPDLASLQAELEDMRKQNQRLAEDFNISRRQLDLYRANLPQQGGQQQGQQQFSDPIADMDPNDVLTVAQVQKILKARDSQIAQAFQQIQRGMTQQQIVSEHKDFYPVMQKHLASLAETNPVEAQALLRADDRTLRLVYENIKLKEQAERPPAQPSKTDAQKKIENAKKPQFSGRQTGGGGLGEAEVIKKLSSDDFRKEWTAYRASLQARK